MKYQLFQTFDLNAGAVAGPILIFPREAPAIRHFNTLLAEVEPFKKYPADYVLLHIGQLNEETGMIQPCLDTDDDGQPIVTPPKTVASGKHWLHAQQPSTAQTANTEAERVRNLNTH